MLLSHKSTDSHKTLITPKAEGGKEKGQPSLSSDDSTKRYQVLKDFQVLEDLSIPTSIRSDFGHEMPLFAAG